MTLFAVDLFPGEVLHVHTKVIPYHGLCGPDLKLLNTWAHELGRQPKHIQPQNVLSNTELRHRIRRFDMKYNYGDSYNSIVSSHLLQWSGRDQMGARSQQRVANTLIIDQLRGSAKN